MRRFEELKLRDRVVDIKTGDTWTIKEKAHSRLFYLRDTMSYCERSMYEDDYYRYFKHEDDM